MGYYVHELSHEPLFNVLHCMHYRCENENHSQYKDYGGKGISVCDEWSMDNAEAFISWAKTHGWEKGLETDRINNDKDYSPDNCRFVNRRENCRNRKSNHYVEINGESLLISDAVAKYAVCTKKQFETRYYSLKWPLEKALFQPVRPMPKRKIKERID